MYLAGVAEHRVEDITEALWGSKVSPATISQLNKKACIHIEDWRNRPLCRAADTRMSTCTASICAGTGRRVQNVTILPAIAVKEDGFHEIRRRICVVGTFPPWELRPDAGLRKASPCGGYSVGQQEVQEHEAFGGGSGRRLHCRPISFSRSLQINLRPFYNRPFFIK